MIYSYLLVYLYRTLQVRAQTEYHQKYADSLEVTASTYSEPKDITLLAATSNTLNVSWEKYTNKSYVM